MYAMAYTQSKEAIAYMSIPLRTAADIGALIRERRQAAGMDQATLAKRARVSRLWINEVEQGKPGAGIARILRTLAALDLQVRVHDRKMSEERTARASQALRRLSRTTPPPPPPPSPRKR
ncbi:helix-turn-helix domain-containing protein [Allosphingosinicella flava]|nr:helix-turn-helix domain-containing protein [Sphingosinicella flava]